MNILLSSAGRQAFLVNEFKEAVGGRGKVFVTDYDRSASSLKVADEAYIAPPYTFENYVTWVLDLCKLKQIDLILSLNVDDLLLLERYRQSFFNAGCFLIGGNIEAIRMTFDKYALGLFCNKVGLNTPKTYLAEDLIFLMGNDFPLFAKPRFGKGSRGIVLLNSYHELDLFLRKLNDSGDKNTEYIFQSFIEGQEYGFDIINDFRGKFAGLLTRKKFAMKNGETYKAVTEKSDRWLEVATILSKEIKHQGTIDVDAIVKGGQAFIIDINFRFGGGYVFSHLAGANIPRAYIAWAENEPVNPEWFNPKEGVIGIRTENGALEDYENL